MQFQVLLLSALTTLSLASPLTPRAYSCSSGLDTLQCCDVSVDGVLNLNCAAPSETPTSLADFKSICSAGGQSASCCVLPILGQALLCTAV